MNRAHIKKTIENFLAQGLGLIFGLIIGAGLAVALAIPTFLVKLLGGSEQ